MGNKCPCLQECDKTNKNYVLFEEKNRTLLNSEEENNKDHLKNNPKYMNGVQSFGPPSLASNGMGINSPHFQGSLEDEVSDQMKQSQNSIEILIKNEGDPDDKENFKKKVQLEDFHILKVFDLMK